MGRECYTSRMDSGLHHLHSRKRIYQKLEKYPSDSPLRRVFDKLMYVLALTAPMALLPQVLHIYSQQNAAGLIPHTWIIFIFGHTLWIVYGTLHKEIPIIISHFLVLCLNVAILVGIYLY